MQAKPAQFNHLLTLPRLSLLLWVCLVLSLFEDKEKTKGLFIIIKARDLIKLLSRSVPAPQVDLSTSLALFIINKLVKCLLTSHEILLLFHWSSFFSVLETISMKIVIHGAD